MEEFSEKDIEEIIAKHPEIIEKGLTLKGRQVTFRGKRVDLIFEDRTGAALVVELKKGIVEQKDVGQLTDYLGLIGQQERGRIRIMLIGSMIPKLRRDGMDRIGIEYREIAHQDYIKFLKENDHKLLEGLQRKPTIQVLPSEKAKERPRIMPVGFGAQRFWIFQTNPKRFRIFDWWDDLKRSDQWRINKRHRDKIRKMGIDALWVAMVGEDDVWSIKMQYHEKIANDNDLQATFLSEKYDSWSIFQHQNDIHKGDMAVIWVAGRDDVAGIYGIAEIMTEPYESPRTHGEIRYWVDERDRAQLPAAPWLIVSIRYVKMLFDEPILRPSIRYDSELQDLIILRFSQATNVGPVPLHHWQRITELARLTS